MKMSILSLIAGLALFSITNVANAVSSCGIYSPTGINVMMGITFDDASCELGNGYHVGEYVKTIVSDDGVTLRILCLKKPAPPLSTYFANRLEITIKGNSGTLSSEASDFVGYQLKCR